MENNPVRAKLSDRAESRPWSSAAAHVSGKDDGLASVKPMLSPANKTWTDFLGSAVSEEEIRDIQKHERTGRPLCATWFLEQLEALLDRPLKPKKPGRKPKNYK